MKYLTGLILILIGDSYCCSQNIERKIVVQNNSFFYTTIHEEFQIGTLHIGTLLQPLKDAKKLALPAGRNYNRPVNPFSWDITDSLMYAVNNLNHPLNNKNEALKCFKLSTLKEWTPDITIMDMIMKGTEENTFAYNDPYKFIKRQSKYMNGFYFDGIVFHDSIYVMVIVNNNQLSIWNYSNNKKWTHSNPQSFTINGFFNLFEKNKQLYIVLNNGNIHKLSLEQIASIPEIITNKNLNDYLLILNRDNNTVQFIKNNDIQLQVPFQELIKKKGIYIF